MSKRRKAPAMPAVQSKAEAIDLLGRYSQLQASIDGTTARTDAAIAQLKTERDAIIAPQEAEMKTIAAQLQPWWEANRDELAGDRRSIELGGCQIGHRLTPPSLGFPKPEQVAVTLLRDAGWVGLLRVKMELDKPAVMTAIRLLESGIGPDDVEVATARRALTTWGFKIVQKDEFFIEPATVATTLAAGNTTLGAPAQDERKAA